MRVELACASLSLDGRGMRLLKRLTSSLGPGVEKCTILDVYIVDGVAGFGAAAASDVFLDPVAQRLFTDGPGAFSLLPDCNLLVEVTCKPGVANPEAQTAEEAISLALGRELSGGETVQTARQYAFVVAGDPERWGGRIAAALHNPLIEKAEAISIEAWREGRRFPAVYPNVVPPSPVEVKTIRLAGLGDEALAELSGDRLLFLSLDEMRAVRDYYLRPETRKARAEKGLPEEATDVELEMIAQTWSEHCKHKIFSARIRYREDGGEEEIVDSLFATYIRKTTEDLKARRPDLRSVFHDNAGVVDFDGETLVCIKAETHNSPSALDPYGGAITGIVGVNRDILGTGLGARPIFNTNVLCFGDPSMEAEDVPRGLLHPKQVLSGVHRGIVDGGNQSGIPVAAGAFLFDESYTGKPLVFCGTAGILPSKIHGKNSWEKKIEPGYLAVMAGGRIGKDGIHGATFSSAALDEASPTSAVQIGDPITQKKLSDFLLEARDLGLYQSITDNGAGGLSSSLGEMARDSGGVRVDLDACPLKYAGLAPWEIFVSESQERMSFAVAKECIEDFLALAKKRGVEAAVVGRFTDSGSVEVFHGGKLVASLTLDFLHEGLPRLDLRAEWKSPARPEVEVTGKRDFTRDLLDVLAEPNTASKEPLVRQYDHEVQAGSVVKPFCGRKADGPSDGGVFKPRYDSRRGLTVTHGICPRVGDADAYAMALSAVDEAYRAHIALGGDPDLASALDNFCWPDPVESPETPDGAYKLAQLVRTCRGLREACLAYNLPLISGKDSMKNDARIGGKKVSVRPTLLVTVMGIIPDVGLAVTSDFKRAGDAVYLLGEGDGRLGGSVFEKLSGKPLGPCPVAQPARAARLYRRLHEAIEKRLVVSCHDVSDGGLAACLAESCIGGGCGADVSLRGRDGTDGIVRALFSEPPSRFVASVRPENAAAFEEAMGDAPLARIGTVIDDPELVVAVNGFTAVRAGLDEIETAWKRFAGEL